jgi:hypothetical protein
MVHVLWRDSVEEVDIIVIMELGHVMAGSWFGTLKFIVSASPEIEPSQGQGKEPTKISIRL